MIGIMIAQHGCAAVTPARPSAAVPTRVRRTAPISVTFRGTTVPAGRNVRVAWLDEAQGARGGSPPV